MDLNKLKGMMTAADIALPVGNAECNIESVDGKFTLYDEGGASDEQAEYVVALLNAAPELIALVERQEAELVTFEYAVSQKVLELARATPQAQPALTDSFDETALREAISDGLRGLYGCGRVWSAWNVGTMTEEDFYAAEESAECIEQVMDAIRPHVRAQCAAPDERKPALSMFATMDEYREALTDWQQNQHEAQERAAFEAWAMNKFKITEKSLYRRDHGERSGEYVNDTLEDIWGGWLARAALAAQPAKAEAPIANSDATLAVVIKWLEENQEDVFRNGLWEAIQQQENKATPAPAMGEELRQLREVIEQFMRPYGIYDVAVSHAGARQMDFIEIGKQARACMALRQPAPVADIVREALEATFEQRPGYLTKVAAAVRFMVGAPVGGSQP